MNTVELSVRSDLLKIVDQLLLISGAADKTSDSLNDIAKNAGKTTETQIKKTEGFLGKLRGLGNATARAMKEDFQALFNLASTIQGIKLGGIFVQNIKESFELSDTIRKLASVFGIAEDRFVGFQRRMTEGLGQIGLSSEAAVSSLKGLSETQVRGEENLFAYSSRAGQLASVGSQKGREGEIAKGMANVITAQGLNPNDLNAMELLADSLRKVFNATGKVPTEVLGSLERILATMPKDLRRKIGTPGLVNLGAASAVGGPNATKFLEEYLGKSTTARKPLEARGFKDIFGPKGLDIEKFRKSAKAIMDEFPSDPRMMAQTLGLSEEAAEGFVRLAENLDRVSEAQDKMRKDTRQLEEQYKSSMTASEAFNASLNKTKASFAAPIAFATNAITTGLQKSFETSLDDLINYLPADMQKTVKDKKKAIQGYLPDALDKNIGATATTVGAVGLTALLAGGGINNLMKFGRSKATGVAEREAFEKITGAQVQNVYVVNASEIGQAVSGIAGAAAAGSSLLGKAGAVGGGAFLGYSIGTILSDAIAENTQGETKEGFKGDVLDRVLWRIDQALGGGISGVNIENGKSTMKQAQFEKEPPKTPQKVRVEVVLENKAQDTKARTKPGQGVAQ